MERSLKVVTSSPDDLVVVVSPDHELSPPPLTKSGKPWIHLIEKCEKGNVLLGGGGPPGALCRRFDNILNWGGPFV